ncbi:MAG: nucleotide exchange factor GrpE [Pseudomonadota bacterium]|nr:nucleotide exchange factor GrpE [Pseudomonadota bacterium]
MNDENNNEISSKEDIEENSNEVKETEKKKSLDENEIKEESDSDKKEDSSIDKQESTKEELENQLEEAQDKILRVLAENENVRKQSEKNRIDMVKYGVQPLARELVNVVDNFERALTIGNSSQEKTLEGFELIYKEVLQILEKFSIKKIDALGSTFDANLHQAMFEKPSKEFDTGRICEIVQDGYTFHDRLLRPAMVGISKGKEKNNNAEDSLNADGEDPLDEEAK